MAKKKQNETNTDVIERAIDVMTNGKTVHKLAGWRGQLGVPVCNHSKTEQFLTSYWAAVNCFDCKVIRMKEAEKPKKRRTQ
jgi:hypothetical protein